MATLFVPVAVNSACVVNGSHSHNWQSVCQRAEPVPRRLRPGRTTSRSTDGRRHGIATAVCHGKTTGIAQIRVQYESLGQYSITSTATTLVGRHRTIQTCIDRAFTDAETSLVLQLYPEGRERVERPFWQR